MAGALSLVKIQQKLIVRQLIFADRWPNQLSKAASVNELLCNCPTRLVLQSPCRCSLKLTEQNKVL